MAHPYLLLHDHIFWLTASPKGVAPPRRRRARREEVALRTTSKDGATGGSRDHAFNFGAIACFFSLLTCYPAHLGCACSLLLLSSSPCPCASSVQSNGSKPHIPISLGLVTAHICDLFSPMHQRFAGGPRLGRMTESTRAWQPSSSAAILPTSQQRRQ
jgi:hypothetical protein